MGVDVELKARPFGPMTDEEFSELQRRFAEAFPDELADEFGDRLQWDKYEDEPTIEISTLNRYYGPGYERGHWPRIRTKGDWLTAAIGERGEVRYGGDSAGEWEYLKPWREVREENDAHWEKFENEPLSGALPVSKRLRRGSNPEVPDDV